MTQTSTEPAPQAVQAEIHGNLSIGRSNRTCRTQLGRPGCASVLPGRRGVLLGRSSPPARPAAAICEGEESYERNWSVHDTSLRICCCLQVSRDLLRHPMKMQHTSSMQRPPESPPLAPPRLVSAAAAPPAAAPAASSEREASRALNSSDTPQVLRRRVRTREATSETADNQAATKRKDQGQRTCSSLMSMSCSPAGSRRSQRTGSSAEWNKGRTGEQRGNGPNCPRDNV